MRTQDTRPQLEHVEMLEDEIERLFRARAAAAAARAREAEAVLAARQQRLESVLARIREMVLPVLEEVAAALRRRGVEATLSEQPDPPRITLRLAEANGTGYGPPRFAEGCFTFTAAGDMTCVSARQETWRWRQGGARQNTGTATLADLDRAWVRDQTMEFVRRVLLGQNPDRPSDVATQGKG